jgi:hypothetical protein
VYPNPSILFGEFSVQIRPLQPKFLAGRVRDETDYFRFADKPGVGTEEQNAATLNDFVRVAQIFELPASLIR